MTIFIYKQGSGVAPQAGYEILSMSKGVSETWWLAKTDKELSEVQALNLEKLIVGEDDDADILAKFPDLVAQKATQIRAAGSVKLTELNDTVGGYLKEERETWYVQKAEAIAYNEWAVNGSNGDAPSTPMLDGIVANRPDLNSVADIAALIQQNTAALEAASGIILGKQQSALVQVYMAADLSAALAVEFPE